MKQVISSRRLYFALLLFGVFLIEGCTVRKETLYNKTAESGYQKIESINGIEFQIPEIYISEAVSLENLEEAANLRDDKTYVMDYIKDTYTLFNFENFFLLAASNVGNIDLKKVYRTEDLQRMLTLSGNESITVSEEFQKFEQNGLLKLVANATASIQLTEELDGIFYGKIAFVQMDQICSFMYYGEVPQPDKKIKILEDYKNPDSYIIKSLEAKEYKLTEESDSRQALLKDSAYINELYQFAYQIEGELYRLPMTYDEFLEKGWSYNKEEAFEIAPNQHTSFEIFERNAFKVYADFYNLGETNLYFENCKIGALHIDELLLGDYTPDIVLPGNIRYGVSNKSDIIRAYGEPTDTLRTETYLELVYEYASYQKVVFKLNYQNNVITGIDIYNMTYEK